MSIAIGEIYIYKVPFIDDPTKSKPRPVLIIGTENYHGDILAISGTSKNYYPKEETTFTFTADDINQCLLMENTVFPISKQLLISSSFLKKKVGTLKKNKLNELLKSIAFSQTENSDPSWFGFMITLKDGVKFKRNDIVEHLEKNNIQTRNLFAGNITRHPCFESLVLNQDYRIVNNLKNTDKIMNDSFWIGVYPGMTKEKMNYIVSMFNSFKF